MLMAWRKLSKYQENYWEIDEWGPLLVDILNFTEDQHSFTFGRNLSRTKKKVEFLEFGLNLKPPEWSKSKA